MLSKLLTQALALLFPKSLHQNSITRKTLIKMIFRIIVVMSISVGLSYWYLMSDYKIQTQEQLSRYISDRVQRESYIFQQAHNNLKIIQKKYIQELESVGDEDPRDEFNKLMFSWSDGTMRNHPENQDIEDFDTYRYATAFIGQKTKLTPQVRHQVLVAHKLASAYGSAWNNNFIDLYFNFANNIDVTYWGGYPYGLKMKANSNITEEEFHYIANPQNNPDKQLRWTHLYQDPTSNDWMVSLIAPIYSNSGDFIGTVGQDIVLTQLVDNTIRDNLKDTYNLIISNNGQLIVHPQLMGEIKKREGKFKIESSNNRHLQRIFKLVKESKSDRYITDSNQNDEYLAIAKLKYTDYSFITVYPKSSVRAKAFRSIRFILSCIFIAFIIEIFLLHSVLVNQVSKPLNELILSTKKIANGDLNISLFLKRNDEIGQLSDSFNRMVYKLQEAFLYLETKVIERTQEIQDKNQHLEVALSELKHTQAHLVQAEKMSSLGQLVAGIAHEINNPVSFIYGNIDPMKDYIEELIELIDLYQVTYPAASSDIFKKIDEMDLEFIEKDLFKIIDSIQTGADRICDIVLSLRNFSRLDEAEFKQANIHDGIDNTLMILKHRLKATPKRPKIEIIKEYGNFSSVDCYVGQLNQVFMNILGNAIDALEEKIFNEALSTTEPIIKITTKLTSDDFASITIADNGIGIAESIQNRLFDPFFTTKPVGKGTGMGLSISYQIIVEKHLGRISCDSQPGGGAKFTIEIPRRNSN
jgi:two-component system, NtrC family, sensor kinase